MSKKKVYHKGKKFELPKSGTRYGDDDLSLISHLFFDNLDLLMSLRKHFLQGYKTGAEMITLEKFAKNQEGMHILRKALLPEIDSGLYFGLSTDVWVSVNTMQGEIDKALLEMESRQMLIDYIEQQFQELKDPGMKTKIKFRDLIYNSHKKPRQAFIEMDARNQILRHIDKNLQDLQILAIQNKTPEAEEEAKKRQQDSNQ